MAATRRPQCTWTQLPRMRRRVSAENGSFVGKHTRQGEPKETSIGDENSVIASRWCEVFPTINGT